jgi:hypothetical protein
MPVYNVGEHKVDHPPLFACREHKSLLRISEKFVGELLAAAEDVVAGNLAEYAAPILGGNEAAMRLPDYLIPPRLVIFNPDMLRGPEALPFAVIFVDKKFMGVPAHYFTKDRFEGCPECGTGAPLDMTAAPARMNTPAQGTPAVSRPRPGGDSSGRLPVQRPGAPQTPRPGTPQQPTPRPGSGGGIIRRAPIPGLDQVPGQKQQPPRRP